MHQKLKLDRAIHLEKYEIFFNAYVPGLYIGLGMAIRWSMTIPEPAMYSPVSSSKNELPNHPIETNEEIHQKLKLDRAIHLAKYEICFKAIYSYIFQAFPLVSGWRVMVRCTNDIFRGRPCSPAQNKTQLI